MTSFASSVRGKTFATAMPQGIAPTASSQMTPASISSFYQHLFNARIFRPPFDCDVILSDPDTRVHRGRGNQLFFRLTSSFLSQLNRYIVIIFIVIKYHSTFFLFKTAFIIFPPRDKELHYQALIIQWLLLLIDPQVL